MFLIYAVQYFLQFSNTPNFIFRFLKVYFGMLDGLLAAEQLPEEYRERCQVSHCHSPITILIVLTTEVYLPLCSCGCSRIYFATTVRKKVDLDSTGSITNVASVVHTTPES